MSGWRKRTIMEMAREADPKANLSEPYFINPETRAWLERFAELVRADEREACAKVCENVVSNEGYVQSKWCVDAIRAREQA